MIDLTPLDVRNKKGDFAKTLRGYDPEEVDTFLDLVAERLEALVRETMTLRERSDRLLEQVSSQEGRERAVQEALVTAQELREEVRAQAERQAQLIHREAEGEARRIVLDAEREVKERKEALEELERKRLRFLRSFRSLLERELDVVEVEEGRTPLEDVEVEMDLGGGRVASHAPDRTTGKAAEEARATGVPGGRDGDRENHGGDEDHVVPGDHQDHDDGGYDEGGTQETVGSGSGEERTGAAEDDMDDGSRAGGTLWMDDDDETSRPPLDAPVHELAEGTRGGAPADEDDLWLSSILQEEDEEGRGE